MTDNVDVRETAPQNPITDTDEAASRITEILDGSDDGAPEETPAQPADDAAPDEPTSGDENDNGDEPENAPPLKMPLSWSKEDIAVWDSLPREAQEKIAQREQQRDRDIRTKQNELAELRKRADAEVTEISVRRQQYLEQAPQLLVALNQVVSGDPALQMTDDQLANLAQEDPASYIQVKAYREQRFKVIDQAIEQFRQAQHEAEIEKLVKLKEWHESEQEKLARAVPELVDPAKRDTVKREIIDYAKAVGFDDDELNGILDHRYMVVLRDAAIGRTLSDKKAIAQSKIPQKTVTPTKNSTAGHDRETLKRKLRDARSTDEQAAILAQIL